MKAFKDYMNKKKTKDLKIESLTNFSKEELKDLVLRMEAELKQYQEKMQTQNQDNQRQQDETEGFKMTIEQLQEALQNIVKELHEERTINEQKDNLIQELNRRNEDVIMGFEKKKDITEKLRTENINYLREIDELKIRLQLSQNNIKNANETKNYQSNDSFEEKIRENIQLKNQVKEIKEQNQQVLEQLQAQQNQSKAQENDKNALQVKIQELIQKIQQSDKETKNLKTQIAQLQQTNKTQQQKEGQQNQEVTQLKTINEQKEKDIQSWTQSLQASNKFNSELQQKIQILEHENEMKQTKFNHEYYRQKEQFEELIRNLKETQQENQSNDQKDKERCQQLTQELENLRKEEQGKSDELINLQKNQQTLENSITELKIKNVTLEQEKSTLEQNLEQAQRKRELAKREVLKLSEKLEKKLGVIEEEDEGELKARTNIPLNGLYLQKSNSQQPPHQPAFATQIQNIGGQELAAMRSFKKEFEQLYKELLRMVMTAPTSMINQSPPGKQQQQQESTDKQIAEGGQKSVRRVQSVDTMKNQVSASELRNQIVFTIPAQEFSKYERKYNNTLASISEYLENPTQQNFTNITEENQGDNK